MTAHHRRARRGAFVIALALIAGGYRPALATDGPSIRSQAVVNLTFDEVAGDALDTALVGAAKDNARLIGNAGRVRSPFWNQAGRKALVLEDAGREYAQIADSPDVDRPDAVTVSLLFTNLHPLNDGAFHGIFAKRPPGLLTPSNYAMSYSMQSDQLRVFMNHAIDLKAGFYSAKGVLGTHKPVFLTAVFQAGDAPPPDEDEDKDDVLLRFYVNGKIVKPKAAAGGVVVENDVWLTNVELPALVNDGYLTLGGFQALADFTYTSCIIDEFSLFARALSSEEVAALFTEIAGPDALVAKSDEGPAAPQPPEIAKLSVRGLQTGATSLLTVTGRNLLPDPRLLLPFVDDQPLLQPDATETKVEFKVSVPASVAAGHYPVRIQNGHGISSALTVAVDSLSQTLYAESSPEKPVPLPVAISGSLSGQEQARVYFRGTKGQHVVVDLECKRLGSAMEPVLELRSPHQTPVAIAWGKSQYRGDTRIDVTLTEDGVYSVDLHDLAYKATGQNSYRLKIGDLKIVDATFPPAIVVGSQQTVAAIGPGMASETALPVDMNAAIPGLLQPIALPATLGTVGPAPVVAASEAIEMLEAAQPEGQIQTIDARFEAPDARLPVAVSGRLTRPGEIDAYRLLIKPGDKLKLTVESHDLRSPLDPQLLLVSAADGNVLAASEERPSLQFTVPGNLTEAQVVLRDLNGRGGSDFVYRLLVGRAGLPDFSVAVDRERLSVARDGSAVLQIDVERAGYTGPISLALNGADDLALAPNEIPPGVSRALLVVTAKNPSADSATIVRRVRLLAQSHGIDPPIRRVALTPSDSRLSLVPVERADLIVTLQPPVGAALNVGSVPPVFFRGTEFWLPVSLKLSDSHLAGYMVRLSLVTSEGRASQFDSAATKTALPRGVHAALEQLFMPGELSGMLRLLAPIPTEQPWVTAIVRADLVAHAFSDKVAATIYSQPFQLNMHDAVAVQLATNSLAVSGMSNVTLTGKLKRTPGFADPVVASLVGLPEGYSASAVTVPADQNEFQIVLAAPTLTAPADLPNVALRVTTLREGELLPDQPISVKAAP
ncbi:MAG: hypothetical protein ACT4QC_16685 [Planctomycetaceae bacterium]